MKGLLWIVGLIVFTAVMTWGLVPAVVEAQAPGSGVIQGVSGPQITPVEVSKSALAAGAGPSAAQLQAITAHMERSKRAWAARTENTPDGLRPAQDVMPRPGSETVVGGPGPNVPGTFTIFRNSIASVTSPSGFASNINEPAHGAAGANVFVTWNWRAAVSVDGGIIWDDINPFADFPAFCCDQDVLYDRGRDMIIWSRQGIADGIGNNQLKIGRSNNGGATWCTYTLTGATVGFSGNWFDYEHLATTNDFLYVTSNMFDAAGIFQRHILMRFPLDTLRTCSTVTPTVFTSTVGWSWTPVQGAREVMYLGDQISSTGTFRVYTQPETTTTLTFVDRAIPAWTFTNGDGICTVSNGTNPCARADQRITAGVVTNNTAGGSLANGVITFFWNVRQGGSFPLPYVEAAAFVESTKAYLSSPRIFNSSNAWHWAAAAPNERGDIGLTVYYFASSATPRVYAATDDDFVSNPPPWVVTLISSSVGGPSASTWGDYSRVRPYYPGGTAWSASVYTKNASSISEPRFVIFGRERDQRNVQRWWNR